MFYQGQFELYLQQRRLARRWAHSMMLAVGAFHCRDCGTHFDLTRYSNATCIEAGPRRTAFQSRLVSLYLLFAFLPALLFSSMARKKPVVHALG